MNNTISIIIPVFNRSTLIQNTISSILNQSYSNYECIIIDDFSTDSLQNDFINWNLDDRFKLITNLRSKGAQGARNTGLLNSVGEFICFFDSDDVMHPEFLIRMIGKFENRNIDVSTCYSNLIRNGKKIGGMEFNNEGNVLEKLIKDKTYISFNSLVISRAHLMNNVGLLDENCITHQEFELAIRLALTGEFTNVNEYLVDYVLDGEDRISVNYGKGILGKMYIYKKYDSIFRSFKMKKIHLWMKIIREYKRYCKNDLELQRILSKNLKDVKLKILTFLV
jgi:glycosyltransferase involved in cell wall biosynthesis